MKDKKKKIYKLLLVALIACIAALIFTACGDGHSVSGNEPEAPDNSQSDTSDFDVTTGTDTYRDFVLDNVYHSSVGNIHFNSYIPESYDGNKPYALFISLCGYGGYYFQGVGSNIRNEQFVFEAQKYNAEMIIVAPQLNDWGSTSASQTITLTEYLLKAYNIDKSKVFINGYSGGGQTLSIVLGLRPELYAAALHISSVWDGNIERLIQAKTPLYLVIGENDEYYGSEKIKATYSEMVALYERQGLTQKQISDILTLDLKTANYFNGDSQHYGMVKTAFDEKIMSWLFSR